MGYDSVDWQIIEPMSSEFADQYCQIMSCECQLAERGNVWSSTLASEEAYKTACRIIEITKSAFVKRGYNEAYHVAKYAVAVETDSAHTNLVGAIMRTYLRFIYADESTTIDGYDFLTVIEAAGRHDLPENETGDILDNDKRDEAKKREVEAEYLNRYSKLAPSRDYEFERKIAKLLNEMEEKSSVTGRAIYLADKIAALIVALYMTSEEDLPTPYMTMGEADKETRDYKEMMIIREADGDMSPFRYFKASEMWATDFLSIRKINQYDDSGFFTSLLVAITLILNNNEWYKWREKTYTEAGLSFNPIRFDSYPNLT